MIRVTGKTRAGQPRGFTLLEVLVALSVMVFALSALWKILGQSTAVVDALPDRILAMWCAQNRIVLRQASLQWPEPQVSKGSEEWAGKIWYWEEEIGTTSEPRLRRITVKVGISPEALTLATLEGFIRQPETL